jgi:peptidoglycan/LPS O-acetylase OafA/YrhL
MPHQPSDPDSSQRISWNPALEGIRGCAVLLVLMFHFLTGVDPDRGLRAIVFKIASAGWIGVDLFFVLSGYLITSILIRSKSSPRYFRNFYSRRVRRIFPLYYGVLAIMLLILPVFQVLRTPAVLGVLREQWFFWAYASNFMPRSADADWLNLGHFWSLAIEEQFYLCWPAIVRWSDRAGAMRAAACGMVLSILLRLVLQLAANNNPSLSEARHWAFAWTPCRLDSLAVGALIALLSVDQAGRRWVERVARPVGIAAIPAMAWMIWRGRMTNALGAPRSPADFALVVLIYSFLAVGFGTLIVEATRARPSWLARGLAFRPFRFLGKYSYGIYVFQGVLAPVLFSWMPRSRLTAMVGSSDLAAYAFFVISALPILAVSVVSWHGYERRFLTVANGATTPPAP